MSENVFGVHTSNTDYPRNGWIERFLNISTVAKVCVNFSDAGTLHGWHSQYPDVTFLGRHIVYDMEDRELHARFRNCAVADAAALGSWFADMVHDGIAATGLDFMPWESGPNEANDTSDRWPLYLQGYGERMAYYGHMFALGGWSFGLPPIPPLDAVDTFGSTHWHNVFKLIDSRNRVGGVPLVNPRAYFYLHEGALNGDMIGSIPYTNNRCKLVQDRHIIPNGWWCPTILSEFAYGYGVKPSSTEEMMRQIVAINEVLVANPWLLGYCWYDMREVSNNTPDDYRYCYGDMASTIEAQHYSKRVLVPPGNTVPIPPTGRQNARIVAGVNQRAAPSASANLLGYIGTSGTPPYLSVELPEQNGYVKASGQDFWVLFKNLKLI